MRFREIINEVVIDPVGPDQPAWVTNPKENRRVYNTVVSDENTSKRHIKNMSDSVILYDDHDSRFIAVDNNAKKVVYFQNYTPGNIPGLGHCVAQNAVWVDPAYKEMFNGIPSKLFLENLIPRFSTIMCNGFHKEGIKEFWKKILVDALLKGFNAYAFRYHKEKSKITKINNIPELVVYLKQNKVWSDSGKMDEAYFYRICISNINLDNS